MAKTPQNIAYMTQRPQEILDVMRIKFVLFFNWLLAVSLLLPATVSASASLSHPIETLVGEQLTYDVSFLWFDQLAEGSITLEHGKVPGTYLAVMEARTLGVAYFITRHRVERHQTLMEVGPNGLLRPLRHSSHTFKGKGRSLQEKRKSYDFDYEIGQIIYKRVKNNRITSNQELPLETDGPIYDILSAFYNLRLEAFGALDQQSIHMPTFHRKKMQEIVVQPAIELSERDKKFFATEGTLCKILVDPSVFKTEGSELYVCFDKNNRLVRGIIKNVIGLGDVKGVLRY